jgi:ubiquinone/menaquinone biosynthesis C-methylase UbiE/predicted metal-dependent enzyme (double-stranded beta helix superfamily)
MKLLLDKMKRIEVDKLNYDYLFDHILPFIPEQINYKKFLPEITDPNNYARTILLLNPIELVLIHWPPGVESAIHLHAGFWGYVGVLEGEATNVEYELNDGVLQLKRSVRVKEGGLIPEPDGIIHKINNASTEEALVTLHYYYPPLKDLDGLRLFSTDGTMVELNEKAKSASLHLEADCYRSFKRGQFSFENDAIGKSHILSPIIPKPKSKEIKKMILSYYSRQAINYDNDDIEDEKRRKYVFAINDILVEEFKKIKPTNVLDIASGTGRRALRIKSQSGLDYHISGVDMNQEMCELSTKRGITSYCEDWITLDLPNNSFDVITMLYAFGHVPDALERILFLEKVHEKLKPGGVFYFDVFNINDPYEWGSRALSIFNEYKLDFFGYEKGDVFYKRSGMDEVSFLHYFEEERLVALLESLGFKCEKVFHIGYVYKSGQLVNKEEGKLFIKAVKI